MNIAFSAIVALVLIIPGLIFLRSKWGDSAATGNMAALPPPSPQPLSSEAAVVIIASAVLHAVWFAIVWILYLRTANVRVAINEIGMLLIGKYGPNDARFDDALSAITSHPFMIMFYMIGLCSFAMISGMLLSKRPQWSEYFEDIGILPNYRARAKEWDDFFVFRRTVAQLLPPSSKWAVLPISFWGSSINSTSIIQQPNSIAWSCPTR